MGNQIRSTGPPCFSRKKEQREGLGVKEVIENNRMRAWGGVKKKSVVVRRIRSACASVL